MFYSGKVNIKYHNNRSVSSYHVFQQAAPQAAGQDFLKLIMPANSCNAFSGPLSLDPDLVGDAVG